MRMKTHFEDEAMMLEAEVQGRGKRSGFDDRRKNRDDAMEG